MTRGSYWWWVAAAVGMFAVIGALVLIERGGEPDRLAPDPSQVGEVGEPVTPVPTPALERSLLTPPPPSPAVAPASGLLRTGTAAPTKDEGPAAPPDPGAKSWAETAPPTTSAAPPAPPAAVQQANLPTAAVVAPRAEAGKAAWQRYAVPVPGAEGRPMIAIVIDDAGIDRQRSLQAMTLKGPLTFAFLPYAHDLAAQTAAAHASGHELIVHLPMEPDDGLADPGPNALMTGLDPGEILRRLRWDLARFDGYVGVSNHMGSGFTADSSAMRTVMTELKARGLLFLDSRTTRESVAVRIARDLGVPLAERNVFLDNEVTPEAVRARLAELEQVARQDGFAVGIGHLHDVTLDELARWLPEVERRGFALVPISAIVQRQRAAD